MSYLSGKDGTASLGGTPLDITKWSCKAATAIGRFGSSTGQGWKHGVAGTSEADGTLEGKVPAAGTLPTRGSSLAIALVNGALSITGNVILGEVSVECDVDTGEPVSWSASFVSNGPLTGI